MYFDWKPNSYRNAKKHSEKAENNRKICKTLHFAPLKDCWKKASFLTQFAPMSKELVKPIYLLFLQLLQVRLLRFQSLCIKLLDY